MPPFPEKYETWINHFESEHFVFDFHNFETSFSPQVCGFDENCWGAWYSNEISKYIVSHRELLAESVPFYCSFLDESGDLRKRDLKNSIATFALVLDGKSIRLQDFLRDSFFDSNRDYDAIDFFGYLDKNTFIELSRSDSIFLTFEMAGKQYEFCLQIPKVSDDTFRTH